MIRTLALALLIATPAAADSYKITLKGKQHCSGQHEVLGERFEAFASIDMPNQDYGDDGTVWVDALSWKDASYTRSGDYFAITGWTKAGRTWMHVSIHGRVRGDKVRGTFHFLPFGGTCLAEGKVR